MTENEAISDWSWCQLFLAALPRDCFLFPFLLWDFSHTKQVPEWQQQRKAMPFLPSFMAFEEHLASWPLRDRSLVWLSRALPVLLYEGVLEYDRDFMGGTTPPPGGESGTVSKTSVATKLLNSLELRNTCCPQVKAALVHFGPPAAQRKQLLNFASFTKGRKASLFKECFWSGCSCFLNTLIRRPSFLWHCISIYILDALSGLVSFGLLAVL